jgi:phage baseplate assembly protein W
MSGPDYPHVGVGWAFPVHWDASGRVAMVSDVEEIQQSIRIILRTNLGSRAMRPTFGADVDRYVFAPRTDQVCFQLAFDVERALLLYEPRIIVDRVEALPAGEAEDRIDVTIEYRIDSHRRPTSLVVPFYLQAEGQGEGRAVREVGAAP